MEYRLRGTGTLRSRFEKSSPVCCASGRGEERSDRGESEGRVAPSYKSPTFFPYKEVP